MHLYEIFNKVRENDKEIIEYIIKPWFANEKTLKNDEKLFKNIQPEDVDMCKEKILSVQPYSFYFVEQVYQKILDLTSFYCKLND